MTSQGVESPKSVRPELVEGPFFLLTRQEEGRCFDKLSTNGWVLKS